MKDIFLVIVSAIWLVISFKTIIKMSTYLLEKFKEKCNEYININK